MKRISFNDLERVVKQIVQPLYRGSFETIDGIKAKLVDLIPDGSSDNFQHTSHYGFISKPIKGVLAYILNLNASVLSPIILAHLDPKRPKPQKVGEVIIYCLTSDGSQVPVKITLDPGGLLTIDSDIKVKVNCDNIELGKDTLEKIVNGETFRLFFNDHRHIGNMGVETSEPTFEMTESEHLSETVKAKI